MNQTEHTIIFHVHVDSVVIWGLVATLVLTIIMDLAQWMGFSRMSMPFMLGSAVTGNRHRAHIYGFALHLVLGWVFTWFYALVFESLSVATGWAGGILGVGHGLFMLITVMPLVEHIHPRMATEHSGPTPTRMLEPPGFMGLHYGLHTPLTTMLAHVLFGVIIGAFYQLNSA